jgi:hypothetical protein
VAIAYPIKCLGYLAEKSLNLCKTIKRIFSWLVCARPGGKKHISIAPMRNVLIGYAIGPEEAYCEIYP